MGELTAEDGKPEEECLASGGGQRQFGYHTHGLQDISCTMSEAGTSEAVGMHVNGVVRLTGKPLHTGLCQQQTKAQFPVVPDGASVIPSADLPQEIRANDHGLRAEMGEEDLIFRRIRAAVSTSARFSLAYHPRWHGQQIKACTKIGKDVGKESGRQFIIAIEEIDEVCFALAQAAVACSRCTGRRLTDKADVVVRMFLGKHLAQGL